MRGKREGWRETERRGRNIHDRKHIRTHTHNTHTTHTHTHTYTHTHNTRPDACQFKKRKRSAARRDRNNKKNITRSRVRVPQTGGSALECRSLSAN